MNDTVKLVGVRADGTEEVIGSIATPPSMKREEIAREQFGELSKDESGTDADICLWALESYHEWLVKQGWRGPPLLVVGPK